MEGSRKGRTVQRPQGGQVWCSPEEYLFLVGVHSERVDGRDHSVDTNVKLPTRRGESPSLLLLSNPLPLPPSPASNEQWVGYELLYELALVVKLYLCKDRAQIHTQVHTHTHTRWRESAGGVW